MNRCALIHIGIEKTGTSTLQEFLHQNREKLAEYGVGYLQSPGLRNNRKIVTYCMAEGKSDAHFGQLQLSTPESIIAWKKKFKTELVDEIANLSPKIKNVIISSEHFHSRLSLTEEIETLKHLLEPFFAESKIIVYLRRQDKTAVSLYSTACRVGFHMKSIVPLNASEDNHYYNYNNLLEKWSGVFGRENIIPRIFEKDQLENGDLISDFIRHCAMIDSTWELVRPENQNESLSAIAQEVMIQFNKYFSPKMSQKIAESSNELRQILLRKLETNFPGKSKLPCRQDALNFYGVFEKSNAAVARDWFNRDKLFSDNFSEYPKTIPTDLMELDIVKCLFSSFSEYISND